MLLEKAAAYEKTSYKGLFHFVRYIDELQKYDVDFGEADMVGENEDVVRAFLTENPEFEAVSWTHPVCGERADGMVTLLPPVHNTDGFFIAKMHRKV